MLSVYLPKLQMPYLNCCRVAELERGLQLQDPTAATSEHGALNYHPRRALDQYSYHTLDETSSRDEDQVISRFQSKRRLGPPVITVVDQLWLWIITYGGCLTVITCSPEADLLPNSSIMDFYTKFIRQVLENQMAWFTNLQDVRHVLVHQIAASYSAHYMGPSNRLHFGDTVIEPHEVYKGTIRDAVGYNYSHTLSYKTPQI